MAYGAEGVRVECQQSPKNARRGATKTGWTDGELVTEFRCDQFSSDQRHNS
jgi:hypothetical protein